MKLLKRLTVFAVTAVLAAGATTAFAADPGPVNKETKVTATVGSTYTLSIPADQSITFGAANNNLSGALAVSGNIANNKKVTVTVGSTGSLTSNVATTTIPFTVTQQNSNAAFTGANWSAAELRATTPKSIALAVKVTQDAWNAAQAGSYSGGITFTAAIADAT